MAIASDCPPPRSPQNGPESRNLSHLPNRGHCPAISCSAIRCPLDPDLLPEAKVSGVLRANEGRMEIVDYGGRYIVKPPHLIYAELPENEALTMSLATSVGIEVPVHGLLVNGDATRSYFVRRFDRAGWAKRPVEDFAQLSGANRDTKYDSSTERLIEIIDRFCTFPALERIKFFDRLLGAFLTGNEDMHLKNWSLVTRDDKVELSPAYDLLNTDDPESQEPRGTGVAAARENIPSEGERFLEVFSKRATGAYAGTSRANQGTLRNGLRRMARHDCGQFSLRRDEGRYLVLLAERQARLGIA